MSDRKKIKKRKKRMRTRISERHASVQATDELRGKIAARACAVVGVAMLAAAIALPYLMPSWNRALGPKGNIALRIAGIALVIASMLFRRRQ